MSIIKSLQEWLSAYSGFEALYAEIATDFVPDTDSGYALQLVNHTTVSIDVTGKRIYENVYAFYAKESVSAEADRADNNDFVEQLCDYIDDANENNNLPDLPGKYHTVSVDVQNASLFDIYEDGTGIYQIQISIQFERS